VQIVHSQHRGSRDIEHIGSAHTDADLELLKAVARQLAAGQGELDLRLPGSPALSVVTWTGAGPYRNARVKNRRAAVVSRCSASRTSMTCPYWSTAR